MKITITDAELPIMKVLWEESPLTSAEILPRMRGNAKIMKTMLQRLVAKGALQVKPLDGRTYSYSPCITQDEYTAFTSRNFLEKVFDGSSRALMVNFIKEEHISLDEMQALIDMLKEES